MKTKSETLKKSQKKKYDGRANLKPCKPGEIRNPNGRPKKELCIPDILGRIGLETIRIKGKTFTKRELMLKRVYDLALSGEQWAVQFIADRTEGKALERIETNAPPSAVTFRIVSKE